MLGELDVERRIVWTDLAAQRRSYLGAEVGEAAGFVPEGTR